MGVALQNPPAKVLSITVAKELEKPFIVDYREHGGNAWCPTDSGLDSEGRVWVVNDGLLFLETSPGAKKFNGISMPGPKEQIALRRVKYRHGSFYSRNSKNVYLYNSSLKSWSLILNIPNPFKDFEISPEGQIILIGVESSIMNPNPENGSVQPKGASKPIGVLLEAWERFGKQPVHTVEMDEADSNLRDWVSGLPSYDRTWQLRDQILIYNSYTGRLALYDLVDRKVSWIRTPWKGLQFEDLVDWCRQHPAQPGTRRGPVEVGVFDAPGDRLAIYPNRWGIQVLFAPRVAKRPSSASKLVNDRTGGQSPALQEMMINLPVPETESSELFQLRYGTLALVERRIEVEHPNSLETPKGRVWFGDDGMAVPLEKHLAPPVASPRQGAPPTVKGPSAVPEPAQR